MRLIQPALLLVAYALATHGLAPNALAHGGVVLEDDLCVIRIGFLKAHFTGYQPDTSGNEEFCEDIPYVSRSVFVIDYLHDFMREMPVDFRILNDAEKLGRFARWEDVAAMADIEAETVYYLPPDVHGDGVLKAEYGFDQAGYYIGVITAQHPTEDKVYRAVFPFQVGQPNYGTILWVLGIALLVGTIWQFRRVRATRGPIVR